MLADNQSLRERVSVLMHEDLQNKEELNRIVQHDGEGYMTDAVHGITTGATIGFFAGGVLGTILAGPFGLLGGGSLVGMIFGAGAGTVQGALAAGLIGSGLTDHSLQKLANRLDAGDILVAIRCDDSQTEVAVEAILRWQGARIAEKTLPALPLPKFMREAASE